MGNQTNNNVVGKSLNSKLVKLNTKLVVWGVRHCRSCLWWTSALWFLLDPRFSRDGSMPFWGVDKTSIKAKLYTLQYWKLVYKGISLGHIMKNVLRIRYWELEKRFYILAIKLMKRIKPSLYWNDIFSL